MAVDIAPMPDQLAIIVSIVFMAVTIVVSAGLILEIRPLPYARAVFIASFANVLGKILVSLLQWPSVISYSLPTLSFLTFSWIFFKPGPAKLLVYWLFGFALYLVIHITISSVLGWTFMFPFWRPKVL